MYALGPNQPVDQRKIWPNLSLASAEAIKQTQSEIHLAEIKMPKKRRIFVALLLQIFLLPQLFLWLQKIVFDLIYWI